MNSNDRGRAKPRALKARACMRARALAWPPDIFLSVHTCMHTPGLRGSLHGPLHTPMTLEFNFSPDLAFPTYDRIDYASWKETSGNFSMRARKNACVRRGVPCFVIHVCSISQKTNCLIMIPKTVLISGLWRSSWSAWKVLDFDFDVAHNFSYFCIT